MAKKTNSIEAFSQSSIIKENIFKIVRGAGFEISNIKKDSDERMWGYILKPNKIIKELFSNREILLWVAEYEEFQMRTLKAATLIIKNEYPRLNNELVIIVTEDHNTKSSVAEIGEIDKCRLIGFSSKELSQFKPLGENNFSLAIQEQFFSRDLFLIKKAIKDSKFFFGSSLHDCIRKQRKL